MVLWALIRVILRVILSFRVRLAKSMVFFSRDTQENITPDDIKSPEEHEQEEEEDVTEDGDQAVPDANAAATSDAGSTPTTPVKELPGASSSSHVDNADVS